MANISSYPLITPKAGDLVLITETYDINAANPVTGNPTRSATLSSIVDLANAITLGYSAYTVLLTQSGVNAPVATELQNKTTGTFVWTRSSTGVYVVTASSAVFTSAKTIVFMNLGEYSGGGVPRSVWTRNSDTQITISNGGDDRITNGAFEVRVYE